ncbi:MAG: hypothetical protein KAU31_02725, partial [Spirochaetaceae bacterium]|nr:hypothetical protein [Spirochaetaceae bacterium]
GATSDVNIGGSIGDAGAAAFTDITVTGNDITLSGIGTAGNNGATGDVVVTANNDAFVDARIILNGTDYRSGGTQSYSFTNANNYTTWNDWISVEDGFDIDFMAGGSPSITFGEIYINLVIPGPTYFTLTFFSDIEADRLVLFNGNLSLDGNDLTLNEDLAAYGSSYMTGNDPERAPAVDEWIYPQESEFPAFLPLPGVLGYNGSFVGTGLTGNTITVGDDFYNNGADMNGTGAWNLNVPALGRPDSTQPATSELKWGDPYAVAFNMTVGNSTATSGNGQEISAAASSGTAYSRTNNDVTHNGANPGWDATVPELEETPALFAKTRFDNVLEVNFSEDLYNAGGEILTALGTAGAPPTNDEVGQVWVDTLATGLLMNEAYSDEFGAALPAINTSTFFLAAMTAGVWDTAKTWNTDADGSGAGVALSTNTQNDSMAYIVDINFIKGLFYDAQSSNYVPGYGSDGYVGNPYVDVEDYAPPALVAVEAGRHEHDDAQADPAAYDAWDGHNYFELKYSEPVNFGTTGYLQ